MNSLYIHRMHSLSPRVNSIDHQSNKKAKKSSKAIATSLISENSTEILESSYSLPKNYHNQSLLESKPKVGKGHHHIYNSLYHEQLVLQ